MDRLNCFALKGYGIVYGPGSEVVERAIVLVLVWEGLALGWTMFLGLFLLGVASTSLNHVSLIYRYCLSFD